MASKLAKAFLAANGIDVHNGIEKANLSTSRGSVYTHHVIEMDTQTGTSKRTVGWARDINDARQQVDALRSGTEQVSDSSRGGADYSSNRLRGWYIIDVRTGKMVR